MRDFIRISLIGAECTGKSSAAQALSLALQERGYWAQYLPETLRLFCTRMGRLPKLPDEALIFETQLKAEHAAELAWQGSISRRADSSGPGFLICDSSALQIAFTSHWYFNDESLLARGLQHQKHYAYSFLFRPNIPWVPDGLQRDGPQTRSDFDRDFHRHLESHGIAFEDRASTPDPVHLARRLVQGYAPAEDKRPMANHVPRSYPR